MKAFSKTIMAVTAVGALSADPALADGCKDIGRINQSVQAARRQLDSAVEHDRPRGELGQICSLSRQIDQGVRRMIAIIDADPGHCRRSPAVVQRLRNAATHLYLRTACPTTSERKLSAPTG